MNRIWTIMIITFFMGLYNEVALSLGITEQKYDLPSSPALEEGSNILDGISWGYQFVVNNVGSFFQLLTFQTGLPTTLNGLLILPLLFGIFTFIFMLVRGN